MATLSQLFVGLFNAATGGYNNQFKTSDANTLASVVGLVTNRDVTTDANYINVVLGNLGVSTTSAVYGEAYTAMQGLVNTQGRGGAVIAAADFLAAQSKISTSAYYSIGKAFMSNVAKAEAFTATHPTETGVTNLVAAVTGVGGSNTFTTGTDTLSGIAGDELFTALFTTSTTTNTVASTDSLTDSSKTDSDTLTFTVGGDLYSDATTSAAPALRNIENLVFNIDTTTADLATTATYDNSASVLSVDSSTMTGVKSYSFDVVKPVSAVTGVGLLNAASGSVVNVSAKLASAVVGTATTAGNVTINMANAGVPGTPATVTVPTASTDVVVNGAGSLSATASTVTGSVFATAEKAVTVSAAAAKIVNAVAKAGNATISSAAAGTVVDVTASGNVSVTATGAGSLKAVAGGSITTAGTISSTSATFSATGESTLAAANSATSLTLSGNGASATYNMGSATSLANIQVTGDQNVTVKTSGATLPATVSVTDTGSGLFKLELDGAATAHDFSGGLIDVLKFKTDQGGVTTTVKSGQVVTYALDQGAAAIAVKPTATAATNSLTVLLDDGVRNTSAVDVNTSLTITTAKTVLIDGSVDTTSTGAANGYTLTAIDASGANSNVTIASGINNLTLAGTNTVGTGSLTLTGSGTVALGAATLTADTFDASAVTGAVTGTGLSSATVRAIYTGSAADTLTLDGVGTADIRTNAGNDTLTLDNASYSAAKISIDLGAGTDTLVMQSGTKLITGTTGAISLAGVENFKILAAGVSGTDQVSASVLNGQTFNVLASAANATGSLDVLVLDTDKNIDLSGLAASAAADSAIAGMTFITDASANTAGFTFNGIKGAKNTITGTALSDNLTGGGKDDTFNTTTAALFNADHAMIDTIAGGAGNDIVKITTTGGYAIAATDSWANMSSVEKMTTVDNSAAISVTLNANAYDAGLRTIDLSGETTSTVTVNTAAITGGGMSVIGGSGADTITGGSTNDTLKGGAGADVLTGGAGDDSFAFDVSADFATGGAIVDSILGGDGIDTIRIGKGSTAAADFAIANANSWARSSSVETIKAVASSTYNFTVDLPATAFNAGIRTVDLSASAGASNVIDVSDQTSAAISLTLTGSATGATSILGATGNDLITGGSANDTISASAGVDTINAGAGADTITIGGVKQVVNAGAGDDTVSTGTPDVLTGALDGGEGTDTLVFDDGDNISGASVSNFEVADISAVAANTVTMTLAQHNAFSSILGNADNDTIVLKGAGGAITLDADIQNYTGTLLTSSVDVTSAAVAGTLTFNSAHDNSITLTGTAAVATTVVTGAGDDSFTIDSVVVGTAAGVTVDGGAGVDTLVFTGDDEVDFGADYANIETIITSQTTADVTLTLDAGYAVATDAVFTLDASSLTDGALTADVSELTVAGAVITGGASADDVTGSDQADTISGGAGEDSIDGGAGDDVITGGAGNDELTGGDGIDTYVFASSAAANGLDSVTDFEEWGSVTADIGDVLSISAFLGSTYTVRGNAGLDNSVVDIDETGTSPLTMAGKAALVVTAAAVTEADVLGWFGSSKAMSLATSGKTVLVVDNGTDTQVFYINNALDSNAAVLTVGDIKQVAELTGTTGIDWDLNNFA